MLGNSINLEIHGAPSSASSRRVRDVRIHTRGRSLRRRGNFLRYRAVLTFAFVFLVSQACIAEQKIIGDTEELLFDSANRERAARDLPLLAWDEALARAARKHAELMAEEDVLAHQLPGEPDLTTRAWEAGASFSRITENIARGEDPDKFHDGWMHSPGHRANILDSAVDSIGIALVDGLTRSFAVEDFARAVKPLSIDEQEKRVEQLIATHGLGLRKIGADARKSCELERDYAGTTTPRYVNHYETPDISQLPESLEKEIRSHRYKSAAVGACPRRKSSGFMRFRIVVLLY